jgi:hypothetical protein
MTLPNFLILGVTKAGTSSMHYYLRQHPEVYMPILKESRFFTYNPNYSGARNSHTIRTLAQYEQLFADVRGERAIGEASPQYFTSDRARDAIRSILKEPRMVVSLRNPAERWYSAYQMEVREGRYKKSFMDFVEEDDSRLAKYQYSTHMRRYLDTFPRNSFYFVRFDDFAADPQASIRHIFGFLGVDQTFKPNVNVVKNRGGIPRVRLVEPFYRIFRAHRLRKALRKVVPTSIRKQLNRLESVALTKAAPMNPAHRNTLLDYYEADILELGRLSGLETDTWLRERNE